MLKSMQPAQSLHLRCGPPILVALLPVDRDRALGLGKLHRECVDALAELGAELVPAREYVEDEPALVGAFLIARGHAIGMFGLLPRDFLDYSGELFMVKGEIGPSAFARERGPLPVLRGRQQKCRSLARSVILRKRTAHRHGEDSKL